MNKTLKMMLAVVGLSLASAAIAQTKNNDNWMSGGGAVPVKNGTRVD